MAHTLTITLDDRTYAELEAMASIRGESLEGIASTVVQGLCDDPLDKHIGAYPTGATGWADHHHDTIGQAIMVAEKPDAEGLCDDPLLALAGSLDSGLPDLALRHDDDLARA